MSDRVPCPTCGDTGWVCGAHADRPWGDHANACTCGEPGMPCELCNAAGGIYEPRAKSLMVRAMMDKNAPRN
jgi:hypothetical protein